MAVWHIPMTVCKIISSSCFFFIFRSSATAAVVSTAVVAATVVVMGLINTLLLPVSFKPTFIDFAHLLNMLALSAVLILFIVCV